MENEEKFIRDQRTIDDEFRVKNQAVNLCVRRDFALEQKEAIDATSEKFDTAAARWQSLLGEHQTNVPCSTRLFVAQNLSSSHNSQENAQLLPLYIKMIIILKITYILTIAQSSSHSFISK